MFVIIIIMAVGILTGRMLRKRDLQWMGRVINVLIWALLFILGIEVGSDDRIFSGIPSLGTEALIITLAALAGSTMASWLLWEWVNRRKNNGR